MTTAATMLPRRRNHQRLVMCSSWHGLHRMSNLQERRLGERAGMTPDYLPLRELMIVASGSEGERMSVRDGRVERYAELLLGTCLGVERGWQVMVWGTPWARPLLEEVMKQLGERGAYPLLRLTFSGGHWREHRAWLRHAPLDVISEAAPIE